MKRKILQYAICLVSGLFTGLCLLFTEFGFFVFVTLAPAFVVIKKQSDKKGTLRCCIAFCLALCMTGYSPAFSISTTLPENLNFWATLAVYVIICIVHGVCLSAALYIGCTIPAPRGVRWLYAAIFWTVAEWIIGLGVFAWPTLRVSLAVWRYPVFLQSAKFGGQLLVTMIIVAVNALLASSICLSDLRKKVFSVTTAVVIFVCNIALGWVLPDAPKADTKIAVVQSGVTVIDQFRGDVYSTTLELVKNSVDADSSLVILPESILPFNFSHHTALKSEWFNATKEYNADILVGGRQDGHSAVYHFGADGEEKEIYKKVREVPFFENGAGGRAFRILPGSYSGVMQTDIGKVGSMICYESMFSSLTQEAVDAGAEILAVLTNDSWFDTASAKDLHLAHGVYRALESGRTLVQAGLNGNTAVVASDGKIEYSIKHGEGAVLTAYASLKPQNTVYNVIGNWWLFAVTVVLACTSIYRVKK